MTQRSEEEREQDRDRRPEPDRKAPGAAPTDPVRAPGNDNDGEPGVRQQDTAEQQQDQGLEQHRRQPSKGEQEVRREQGGHDRPVGGDGRPHPRPTTDEDERR